MTAHIGGLIKFTDHYNRAFRHRAKELGDKICHMGGQAATGICGITLDQGDVHDGHGTTFAVV